MSTVAESLVKTLATAGVKRIYGIVGDSLNGIIDEIRRQKTIEWVHVRHEEVAAFAAGADAHVTGEIAVCAGSCGPGNLHLINGLFDCHRSSVPVLAHCGTYSKRRDRIRLLPGDASGISIPGMQLLLPVGINSCPDAACAGDRDDYRHRAPRSCCDRSVRRRCASVRRASELGRNLSKTSSPHYPTIGSRSRPARGVARTSPIESPCYVAAAALVLTPNC